MLNASLSTPVITIKDSHDLRPHINQKRRKSTVDRENASELLTLAYRYRKLVIAGRIILIKMSILAKGLSLLTILLEFSHVEGKTCISFIALRNTHTGKK